MDIRFTDRVDAGQRMADALTEYAGKADAVVLALPRGGVVPAAVIARTLNLPLDVVMVKKLGHPTNPEYAIGAVSMKGQVIDSHMSVSRKYIDDETERIRKLLHERYASYAENREPLALAGKTAIVVDDGVATGRTMLAAIELIREEQPKEIVVAVPVGPTRTIRQLGTCADKVICLGIYSDLYAIGVYYDDFSQVSDEEVKKILKDHRNSTSHTFT